MEAVEFVDESGEIFPLESLGDDTIIEIALGLNLDSINKLCQVSHRFNRTLCASEDFWRWKYIQDFGKFEGIPSKNWKSLYKERVSFKWNRISAGLKHSLGITKSGKVVCWGSNIHDDRNGCPSPPSR